MQLRYDEDFLETAVFLCANRRRQPSPHPLQITRFHHAREKLYNILDPDERNTAFFRLHLEWFREWGLEKPLTGLLTEFPILQEHLSVLAVRMTRAKSDDGAELYVNETGQRSAILALRPELLQRETGLMNYLRHEFMHLHDMLNPAFGYSPVLDLPGLNGAQQRLARERYRLVWDISIDGRLAANAHEPMVAREQHAVAFARGYFFWPADQQSEVFDGLWNDPDPCHADFLGLIADPRGLRNRHLPAPGASCPLCDFPTFAWAPRASLSDELLRRIAAEFPRWSPEHGLCGRCLETYQAAAALQVAEESV